MDESLLNGAFDELLSAQRVLVISHIRPDGDAVGSLIGLGLSLQSLPGGPIVDAHRLFRGTDLTKLRDIRS
jgi:nanoRNase/pAp phosphatase (c-di-AMP/oligoRNAs hydrolase)